MENKVKAPTRVLWLLVTLLLLPSASAQEYKAKSASVPAPKKVTATLAARSLPPPNAQAELAEREARLREHHLRGPLQELPPQAILAAGQAYAQESRWIRYDSQTQRYSVTARDVSRAELLTELESLARVAIRPKPDPSQTITLTARGLTLEDLAARILGPETDFVVRLGRHDVAAAERTTPQRKEGPPAARSPGLRAKKERSAQLARTGNLKPAAETSAPERNLPAGNIKAPAKDLLRLAESRGPKKPIEAEVDRDAIRITLKFVQGATPVVVRARPLEGRPVHAPYATGRYLFVVLGADGRPIEYGTFQDPLEVHSYRPEGPHSVKEARSGLAGFSIARESLAGGRLLIVDLDAAAIDDELSDQTVREAIARGKTVLDIDLRELARSMGPGEPR